MNPETTQTLTGTDQAITRYINENGKCSWLDLYENFGPEADTPSARNDFGARLASLSRSGHIRACQGIKNNKPREERCYARPQTHTDPIAPITPPACYDMLRAPVYVPPPCSVLRPGALDYQRHASHGVRC
ncbi:hypothetical protein [Rhodoferax sp.]|uniref:hypothetical protein n=1 Tax=Rhodoferax sp. TaxID=50421 RepID=UPI00263683BF|nr:hypothetical protein [Rhodoferax sp.]MDD2811684.1 hypothetical protein [Rhodoferax sp.]MDD4942570.1 hypothetical protein [Rhodoferax sp.]